MTRFVFRFESLLRTHEAARDQARQALADAFRAVEILDEQLCGLQQQRAELRADANDRSGTIQVDRLLSLGRFDVQLESQQRQLQERRDQIEQEIERRRIRLQVAQQECRKLEKLRERAREKFEFEQGRREQQRLDEIAGQAIYRARQSGALTGETLG